MYGINPTINTITVRKSTSIVKTHDKNRVNIFICSNRRDYSLSDDWYTKLIMTATFFVLFPTSAGAGIVASDFVSFITERFWDNFVVHRQRIFRRQIQHVIRLSLRNGDSPSSTVNLLWSLFCRHVRRKIYTTSSSKIIFWIGEAGSTTRWRGHWGVRYDSTNAQYASFFPFDFLLHGLMNMPEL